MVRADINENTRVTTEAAGSTEKQRAAYAEQPLAVRAEFNKNRRVTAVTAGTGEKRRDACAAQPPALRAESNENRRNDRIAQSPKVRAESELWA